MAIEQFFPCPRTLTKLRSGALGNFLEGFCLWLLKAGFSRSCIRRHLVNVSHLNSYLGGADARPCRTLCTQDITAFFEAYPARCRHRGSLQAHLQNVHASINRFVTYLLSQGLFETPIDTPFYQPLLDDYLAWMRGERSATPGTCELRTHSLVAFLRWLGPRATPRGLAELKAEEVERFFLNAAQHQGNAARRSLQAALRTFFRFCLQQGMIVQSLDRAVLTLRTYKRAQPPRGLDTQQVQQVLAAVDRSTAAGQRDYAILQLLSTYGIRAGQVCALRPCQRRSESALNLAV